MLVEPTLTLSDLRVRAFKDAAEHIKMVDDPNERQHQAMRHLQRDIVSLDYKSRLITRLDVQVAALESGQSVTGALALDVKQCRSLAKHCNAIKSTGPRSVVGERASSQNSRKHGLNSTTGFESSLEYHKLVDLIALEGFSAFACADSAMGLLK